uniref:Transcription factor 25-like n=1 Tax=Saccoglossus kowalevskii TaxID=10224 RepID=A0ABM0LWZ6_SACKO|nr:PREDICTED: transcription factor 25-like [Saccoglossus kowalevskii]
METKALLAIERKQLNPDNEMRRIFGSQIIKSDARRKSHRNKHVRTTWLATPKSTWPHLSKSGMSMNHIERKGGYEYFTFEHSKEYQRVQFEFLEAVESLNPNNIVVKRALYCFECSFHTLFNVTQANCQLDYRRQENRGLFLAIFKHLMFVGQRGCYRTALEFCKLLLSLDSDNDPLCASLMIDFYSLRSQQYSYLIRMYNEWQGHKNLSQLPNFAYSIALAHFHQSKDDDSDLETADHYLQTALLMFPSVLIPLLDKCSIQPDKRVTGHDFFVKAQLNQQAGLQQLVNLYIGRTSSVWKEPEVVRWLECNVNQVLTRVDNKDPLVEEYRKKRQMRYHGTPVNILRHILLSEIKEATVSLPPDLSHAPMMTYDPLPPEDNIVSYTRPPRGRQGPASNQDNSALAAFFRSLLPSYGLQGERQDGQQPAVRPDDILARGIEGLGAVGGNDVQTGADLGRSIETLMEAMRNLLTTIQPQANDDEDEVESD